MKKNIGVCIIVLILALFMNTLVASAKVDSKSNLEKYLQNIGNNSSIPGMSIVIIENGSTTIKTIGYADKENKAVVTPKTKFELASCSKSFTALAAVKLDNMGLVKLDDPVSKYLPWFNVKYKGLNQEITLNQLLHHTSGIPTDTIFSIPVGSSERALQDTVRSIVGIELKNEPGKVYEYATINYDIIGAVIEKVTGTSYEEFMEKYIFTPLGLVNTSVGKLTDDPLMAKGYKIGFFSPRQYDAPVFRGNNPAGYVVTNVKDMERWLKIQMGLINTPLKQLIEKTHIPDRSVSPNHSDFSSYALGWFIYQDGTGEISHTGLNPNFTSYVSFRPEDGIGVAVLANSNSSETVNIGQNIMGILQGNEIVNRDTEDKTDKLLSILSILLTLFVLFVISSLAWIVKGIINKKRVFKGPDKKKIIKIDGCLILFIPILVAIYLLPKMALNTNWDAALVWAPVSLPIFAVLIICATTMSYILYIVMSLFPHENKYKKDLPILIILSLVSGISNSFVIFFVTNTMYNNISIGLLFFYFLLIAFAYISCRKIVETKLVRLTQSIVYDLRIKIIDKILRTSYQQFEKIDSGRVITIFSNDITLLGGAANIILTCITSAITITSAFLYLGSLSLMVTLLILVIIILVAGFYYILTQKTRIIWEQARDMQTIFMEKINGILNGFKELSMHSNMKDEYKNETYDVSRTFKDKVVYAFTKFINTFLIGESFFVFILGFVSFIFPMIFLSFNKLLLSSFIMILLYILGPINQILRSVPDIMQMQVARGRINKFIEDIPSREDDIKSDEKPNIKDNIQNIEVRDLVFQYEDSENNFSVGPINLKVNKGEAIFVIGGNGSGKTTLIKLLTGLYNRKSGDILINGQSIQEKSVGEYISAIFNDFYLFDRLYNVDTEGKKELIEKYLVLFELTAKVKIENGCFSTTKLSTGQRKRLALLRCILEDKPIYIFDELAADQDPQFRDLFYMKLIPEMKKEGKILIAITHDDHYFSAADKILKMYLGKADADDNIPEVAISESGNT